jgi:hypothetical protein
MREQQRGNHAASSKDMNSNDKNAPAISRHDDANDKKQHDPMAPNHLQNILLMRRSRLKGLG